MTDPEIATSAEQPINSDGAPGAQTMEQGDLVGLNSSGELVQADADSATAVHAVGVLAAPVDDESTYPSGQFEFAAKTAESNRASIQNGKKVGWVVYGAEIYNNDEDWGFTPSEPVYLDVGGGFTQTKPSGSGEIVQYLGWAAPDGETVFLDIDGDYETLA